MFYRSLLPILISIVIPVCLRAQSPIPNGNMESWFSITTGFGSYEDPSPGTFWNTANELAQLSPSALTATKTTDAHSGTYAIKLETKSFASFLVAGILGSGDFNYQNTASPFTPGRPFTDRPSQFSGFYKFAPVGSDSAKIFVRLTRWVPGSGQELVGSATQMIYAPASSYTGFSLPIQYENSATPDTVMIVALSSAGGDQFQGQVGTALYVDDLSFEYSTPVLTVPAITAGATLSPNPAHGQFVFSAPCSGLLTLTDISGHRLSFRLSAGDHPLSVSHLPHGTYGWQFLSDTDNAIDTGKLILD